jgi:photosystem II stability/assembly factor-like uncharacterized protein
MEQLYKWVWFASSGTGYVASQYTLVRTRDRGATWIPVRDTIRENFPGIREMFFASEQTFFVDGWRGIWRTTDGGTTFERLNEKVPAIDDSTQTDELRHFFFLDAGRGWAFGDRQLLITRDGGKTWLQRRLRKRDFGFDQPSRLSLFDAQRAVAIGADRVFRTEDEGLHWTAVPTSRHLDEVQCTSSGFCAGRTLSGVALLHVSTDAGKSWQAVATGLDPDRDEVTAVQVVSPNDVVLVGTHNDQGRSERLGRGPRVIKPTAAPFRGLLVRWNGTMWERHEYPELARLRAIHFVNATEAWASADLNGLLYSTDGAKTWTFVPDYYRQAAALTPAPTPLFIVTPPPTP